jgi:SAM-dependent methyltransferase
MEFICTSCHKNKSELLIDLGLSAIANEYPSSESDSPEAVYSLQVHICKSCEWMNVSPQFEEDVIFKKNYAYASGVSETWKQHCRKFAQEFAIKLNLGKHSQIVEVASNDGTLLKAFENTGARLIGIEPTESVANIAIADGIETEINFLSENFAKEFVSKYGHSDLVVANNVLAHVPDPNDFVCGLKQLAGANGVISIECPDALNMIKLGQFDTIYHEHFSYITLRSLTSLLNRNGLKIIGVNKVSIHGGSLRVLAADALSDFSNSVHILPGEIEDSDIEVFQEISYTRRRKLVDFLIIQKLEGRKVIGFGAAAKGATFLNFAGVNRDLIESIIDNGKLKQGKRLPGTGIPIVSMQTGLEKLPDIIVILAWNISNEILSQIHESGWKGDVVKTYPNFEVVTIE